MTSTEFALIGALLAAVAFLSVKEIGGAMSGSMMTMADNVGGGGGDPVPQTGSGDGGSGSGEQGGGDSAGGGDNTAGGGDNTAGGGDQSGPSDPAPTAGTPPDDKKKKKKKKKKKDKKKKKKK